MSSSNSPISNFSENKALSTALLGLLVAAVVVTSFYLLFWNKFLGYHAGGGQVAAFAWMCSKGLVPHKDFFLGVPCLNLVKDGWLLNLFQHHYIGLRAFGIFQRVMLAAVLFWWFGRLFGPRAALVGAILTVVAGFSDLADYIFVYNDEVLLYSLISGLIASYVIDETKNKKAALIAGLGGIFAGLSLMTKQTNGLGTVLIVPLVMVPCLFRLDGKKKALVAFAGYLAGLTLTLGSFFAWMGVNGIIAEFLRQILIIGPAAKAARAMDFLTRIVYQAVHVRTWALVSSAVLLALTYSTLSQSMRSRDDAPQSKLALVLVLFLGLVAIAFGAYYGFHWSKASEVISILSLAFIIVAMYYTYLGVFLISVQCAFAWLANKLTRRQAQIFMCAAMGVTQATMSSLSAPFIPGMLVPGFGFLIAALLESKRPWLRALVILPYLLCLMGVAMFKLHCPYIFEDFSEPPASIAQTSCTMEEMKGFVLPKKMAALMDEGVALIKANTTEQDSIYCYPEGSWFYALAERRPPTFSMSHNIDTTSDQLARQDAAVLLAKRPKMLVYYRTPEPILAAMENMWRGGNSSGNREIIKACETLAGEYTLLKTFDFPEAAPGGIKVMIYLRPESPSEKVNRKPLAN